MSITLITGPMFAGKTKKMVDEIIRYLDVCPVPALIVNSILDIRDDFLSSHHSNFTVPHCKILKVSKLEEIKDYKDYCLIGIDEAQFYEDLYETVVKWRNEGIHVFCAGLSTSFEMKSFEQIEKLYPIVDRRFNVYAVCVKCVAENPMPSPHELDSFRASFNKRIVKSDKLYVIGGEDCYIPVCWNHFTS
jgi:thymidine kinase